MKEKFSISGMSCAACSSGIERTINRLDGIKKAEVSLMGESMLVEYDENVISSEKIIQAVVELGYDAEKYDERAITERKAQPDKLKKRFLSSLIFLAPLMYLSMGGMISFLPQPNKIISASIQRKRPPRLLRPAGSARRAL